MRFLAILLACIAAAGCSSMSTGAKQLSPVLDPFVGRPVSELVNRFGPPSSDYSSSAVATTYEWTNFTAGQSGTTGCRVLVVAHRTAKSASGAAVAFTVDAVGPEEYAQWTVDSWSSFGSACH
jgi:hypothetical protein